MSNDLERQSIVAYLRKGAAIMLTSDMDALTDADDRREIETAARALEAAADEIERGAHL
jgi:hypothetical protein